MAGSLTDIFAAMQNGVVALGNFKRQLTGSFNNISGQITTLSSQITTLSSQVGTIGQYAESIVLSSLAIPLTSTVESNLTSISLSSGDWDVTGNVAYGPAATTNFTLAYHTISQVSSVSDFSNAVGFQAARWGSTAAIPGNVPGNTFTIGGCGPLRKSLAAPTTIYLVAEATFTVSTVAIYGALRARRVSV